MATWECADCETVFQEEVSFCSTCGSDRVSPVDEHGEPDASGGSYVQSAPGQPVGTAAPESSPPVQDAATGASYTTVEKVLLGSCGVTVLGALLPWISVSVLGTNLSKRGIEADGQLTAAAAVVVGALYFFHWTRRARLASVGLGVLVAGIGLMYINDPLTGVELSTTNPEMARRAVDVGTGLYLTAIGGVGIIYAAFREYRLTA